MKLRNGRQLLWGILALLWLLVIWGNSLQTAAESSQKSLGFLEFLTPLLAKLGIPEELHHTLVRKLAHLAEYGILGILWAEALLPVRTTAGKTKWACLGAAALICLAAAAVDETIQRFVPGRSGELRDVEIDFAGAVIGILFVKGLQHLIGRNKKREE